MTKQNFIIYTDLEDRLIGLFRMVNPWNEVTFSVNPLGELQPVENGIPVLISRNPGLLSHAEQMDYITVQVGGSAEDRLVWPEQESEEERVAHFTELLKNLINEYGTAKGMEVGEKSLMNVLCSYGTNFLPWPVLVTVIDRFPIPILRADAKWNVMRMNAAFLRFTGMEGVRPEDFSYLTWKREQLSPISAETEDPFHHSREREYSLMKGEKFIHIQLLEQEIRDSEDRTIGYFIMIQDVTSDRNYDSDMLRMSYTDPITGLHNRKYFTLYLRENSANVWTLLYMDLNNFKQVNINYGHSRGDEVLIGVAELLTEIFRGAEVIRLGGDEFAVLLQMELNDEVMEARLRTLDESIQRLLPEQPELLSVSVGVVTRRGKNLDVDAFIREGDMKLAEAKRVREARLRLESAGNDVTVVRQAMDLFRETFISLEALPGKRRPGPMEQLRDLARFLRIAKIDTVYYENQEREHQGEGDSLTLYEEGEADTNRFIERRNVTRGFNIAYYRAMQGKGEPDWTTAEREGVDLLLRMIFVFHGRGRLLEMAERLNFFDAEMNIHNLKYYMNVVTRLSQENRLGDFTAMRFGFRRFTAINQQLGRKLGTMVMRRFVKQIEAELEGEEMICRVGGDNFVVLVEKDHEDDILDMLEEAVIVYNDDTDDRVRVVTHVGVYQIPDDGRPHLPTEIMDRITRASQRAKVSKDTSVVYFDAVMVADTEREIAVEAAFQEALEKEEFQVYYQPKVDMVNYRLVGAEALCRWFHNGKMIPPGDFIPLLEQSMEVCALDMYMLDHVCRDIRHWLDEGKQMVCVSVNLSRRNLADVDILRHILEIIDRNNVPHEYVEVELTETTTDSHFVDLHRIVEGLQEAGVKTAVDDFGIGYSSLTLIRDLPWDVLKIDRSFLPVEGENGEHKKKMMFDSVVTMAQGLGMECIVEGVETKKQLNLMKDTRCDQAQGFFFDRPMPKEEFEKRMNDNLYEDVYRRKAEIPE